MFNRLKNFNLDSFLDSKIAEEQAKQRGQSPSGAPRRQPSGARRPNASPSKRPAAKSGPSQGDTAKGPDPSEFIIEDHELSSRAATPRPVESSTTEDAGKREEPVNAEAVTTKDEEQTAEGSVINFESPPVPELSQEVQAKLRRLQKLESKYSDLLRSYRVAHARVSTIEPFEASLRENTPLTSITEPAAFTEYLSQVNLKGDMIMSELKSVTEDRNKIRIKLAEAEKQVESLDQVVKAAQNDSRPAQGGMQARKTNGHTDDFFSYESEIPRIQSELEEKARRVDELLEENERLRKAIEDMNFKSVGKVASGEAAAIKHSDREDLLSSQVTSLNATISAIEITASELEQRLNIGEQQADLPARITVIGEVTGTSKIEAAIATGKLTDLQGQILALENGRDQAISERQALETSSLELQAESTKKIGILDNLVKSLRSELTDAQNLRQITESELKNMLEKENSRMEASKDEEEKAAQQETFRASGRTAALEADIQRLERELDDAFGMIVAAGLINEAESSTAPHGSTPEVQPATEEPKPDGSSSKKKSKNKKKKKPAAGSTAVNGDASEVVTPVTEATPVDHQSKETINRPGTLSPQQIAIIRDRLAKSGTHTACEASIATLQAQISDKSKRIEELDREILNKVKSIDRLAAKLKGEDELREEIEGLKDDLMHIGNEHVGTKDKLKELQILKSSADDEHASAIKRLDEQHTSAKQTISELEESLRSGQEQAARLNGELESLKASSGVSGKELEDRLATVTSDKAAIESQIAAIEAEKAISEQEREDLQRKLKTVEADKATLNKDLTLANELAQTRFKDLSAVRDRLGKVQPEVNNLKQELERLKQSNDELLGDNEKLRKLEAKSTTLTEEVSLLKTRLRDKENEVKTLDDKLRKAEQRANDFEDKEQAVSRAHRRTEALHKETQESRDKAVKELGKLKDEANVLQAKVSDHETQFTALRGQVAIAKEEAALKSAQQASAQSLMDSMQDQTRELATQMKEVRARCDSLEEELADSQRLLMERSRESETMRRLLADVEGRAEARVKEMRERMDLAIEERDRAEEEAGAAGRRKSREVEELRLKLREAERLQSTAADEKKAVEKRLASMDAQRADSDKKASTAQQELDEIRSAMTQLRDALDERERQGREMEKEQSELKKGIEEREKRLDKMQKGSKTLAEELKTLQASAATAIKQRQMSSTPSTRSSLESARVMSPSQEAPGGKGIDYVYLRNVLLQFLEQKDKKHQMQLVPVLGMLLHFDRKEEQKWMTAINAK